MVQKQVEKEDAIVSPVLQSEQEQWVQTSWPQQSWPPLAWLSVEKGEVSINQNNALKTGGVVKFEFKIQKKKFKTSVYLGSNELILCIDLYGYVFIVIIMICHFYSLIVYCYK